MNTAHRPAPSIRSLVSSLSTDRANAVRIADNQKSLERDGHVQSVPMTSKGLDVMRQAVAAYIQRAAMANPALMLAAAVVLPKAAEQVSKVAAALQEKVTAAVTATAGVLKTEIQNKALAAATPDQASTKSVLGSAAAVGLSTFSAAKQMFAEQRAALVNRIFQQQSDQQRPT